jgi:glyoxylase-like metal-dependent hydrolase (beta-lactamase superfamily II)
MAPTLVDLLHGGRRRALAVYVIDEAEPTLIDCGPASCLDALADGLAQLGLAVRDLRHLLLTHVHMDHAGAAGRLVAENPQLVVHVSEIGARHLVDPRRLESSARRLFGADFDRLWGAVTPVPAANLRVVGGRAAGLESFATPGHAVHHTSFLTDEGVCFTGDVTGVRIAPARYVAPATPPPDIDLGAYVNSLASIEARDPQRLCLSHFGIFEDPGAHLQRMREGLFRWSSWVRDGATEAEFVAAAKSELAGEERSVIEAIEVAAPFEPSYAGLKRYWLRQEDSPRSVASMGSSA